MDVRVKLFQDLSRAAVGLSGVTHKKMFGCDALFANDLIFSMVWKEGRIGVKLVDGEAYAEAMTLPDAAPWRAGTKTMANWVLLPAIVANDPRRLGEWVQRAHASAKTGRKAAAKPKKSETTRGKRST